MSVLVTMAILPLQKLIWNNEVNVEELYKFNEITPHGFTLDKITQELKNLKLAPVMWMDGEDTVVTL